MAITGLEEVRQMPGFTTILKAVLKSQIQHLVDQLARETQEESLVVATCLEDGTISHLGSELGKDFLEDSADMKSSFLGFCLKRKYRQMSSKDQGPNRSSESADSYVSSPMLELDYTSAQTSSPHPVTLCQVSSFGQGVVQLKQQELSHHGQQNSPGKIRISGKHRHEPYKGKGEQKNKTGSRQEQHKGGSTVQSEDLAVDYINASNNSSSLGEEDGNVSIKIEPLDESDKQLQEETAVDSDTRFPAHLSKGASTDPVSSDTNSSPTNKVQTGDATKTIPYPSSVAMYSPSQESFNMENQFSEVIVKIETSVDMYDQEEETSSCSLDLAETKYEKMEQSTCEIQSGKEKGIKETGTKPEECLFSEKKKFSQTGLDKDLHEERDYVAEFPHGYRMYAGNKIVVIPQATSDQPSQNKTTTALKQPTFVTIDESDKDKFINDSRNINTLKKNESAVRQFQRWLSSEPRHVTAELTEIPVERLDDYIGSFLLSIRKADGSNYEPDTLTSYHRGIDRYLREQNYPFSMVNDREFSSSRAVLAAKRKELKMIGKGGRPNAAKPPSTDMQILLKEKKCIGFDTPQQLINKMWLNNTTLFGLRMGTEHHNLRWGDITLKTDADGTDYLEFKGRGNKPRTVSSQFAFKSTPYSQESLESCPIYSYKEFMRRRPDDSCTPESPFYLAINRTRRPDAEVWYKNEPLGENRVRVLMRKLTQKVSDGKTNQ